MEIQLWKEILAPYIQAVDEVTLKFNAVIRDFKRRDQYSPIEMVDGRVKKISSILEKAQRKNVPVEQITEKIEDIAGIRIICQFKEDIYSVVELIKERSDMVIRSEKDYITNMKQSGYRSYHIIVEYKVVTMDGTKIIPIEIQIRTMAMNFWATIEHSLQYKYNRNMPDYIKKRLSSASESVIRLDEEMSSIRDEIMGAQNFFTIKANIVGEILNTIQNLYKFANKREIIKIQDEFYQLYQEGDIDKLERFSKQLDIVAEGYRAQTR